MRASSGADNSPAGTPSSTASRSRSSVNTASASAAAALAAFAASRGAAGSRMVLGARAARYDAARRV